MKKFWNFVRNDAGERILRLEGPIDEDNFWGDEVTPRAFREELEGETGDVTVYINSPGGNVFAAAEIYTMLLEHKGKVTVKIDAIAASAASVIAMAGEQVLMSPAAMLMIHDPMTIAMGNAKDMEKAITTLNEVKASIINAYQRKTGLSRGKISQLMENETWMNAKKAVELGFADEILFANEPETDETGGEGDGIEAVWQPYSTRIMGQTILDRISCTAEVPTAADEESIDATAEEENVEPAVAGLCEQTNMIEEALPDEGEQDESKPETKETEAETKEQEEPAPVAKDVPAEEDAETKAPVIGMDGKTEDGSMPYELLKRQLDFLK